MEVLYYVVIFIFVVVSLLLIGIILLQSSKTGGMGSALAGNSSLASAFGSQGADKLLVRITTVFAVLFMSLAIGLNILSIPTDDVIIQSTDSVLQGNIEIKEDGDNLNIELEDSLSQ